MKFDSEDFMWSNGAGMTPSEAANNANKLMSEWVKLSTDGYDKAVDVLKIIHETGSKSDSDLCSQILKELGEL